MLKIMESEKGFGARGTNPIVESYIPLVEFLGAAVGPNCELVLHDLDDPENSIIAIANGHISGRVVGGPVTNFALWFMRQAEQTRVPSLTGYKSVNSEGRTCRSSSYFIRDERGDLRGMLCINADVTEIVNIRDAVERFMGADVSSMPDKSVAFDVVPQPAAQPSLQAVAQPAAGAGERTPSHDAPARPAVEAEPAEGEAVEVLGRSVAELLENMLDGVLDKRGIPVDRMHANERVDVVTELDDNGFFLLKGGIAAAATRLGVSEPSIYRYLAQARA